jgi:uncharacterized membrane protein
MTTTESQREARADRFVRQVEELKIPDPAAGQSGRWLRVGIGLMVLGLVIEVVAFIMSHDTSDALVQRDAATLALGGVTCAVVGAAVFVRYSITQFLRFWMARNAYEFERLGDRLREGKQ